MSKILQLTGTKPVTYDLEGNGIFLSKNTQTGANGGVGEFLKSSKNCSPITLTPGSKTTVKFSPLSTQVVKIEDLYFQYTFYNGHATDSITIFNQYSLVSELTISINGSLAIKYDYENLETIWSEYLKEQAYTTEFAYNKLMYHVNNTTPLSGDTVAALGSATFQLRLFPVLRWLDGFITNSFHGIQTIDFELTFRPSLGSTGDNRFSLCSSTNNVYGSCQYQNIALVHWASDIVDQRLLVPYPITYIVPRHEKKSVTVDWGTVGNSYSFKLSDHARRSMIHSIYFSIYPSGLVTAYNDADSAKRYSGSAYISFRANKIGSQNILDFSSSSTSNTRDLRIYNNRANLQKYHNDMPLEVLNNSTNLSKFHIQESVIWLKNLETMMLDNEVKGGINSMNSDEDIEITVYCNGTISSTCTLTYVIAYDELCAVGKTGEFVQNIPIKGIKN